MNNSITTIIAIQVVVFLTFAFWYLLLSFTFWHWMVVSWELIRIELAVWIIWSVYEITWGKDN